MNAYILRLVALAFASFFLLHLVCSVVALACAPKALQLARRMPAASASRLLFLLRIAPALVPLLFILGLEIPSYLRLEPTVNQESIGWWGIGAALAGALCLLIPLTRSVQAMIASIRLNRHWQRRGRQIEASPANVPAYLVDDPRPVLALSGIIRPCILVSSGVVKALPPEQLQAAFRHEAAHLGTHDNLKKLALLLVPRYSGFAELERAWARYSEWAADDRAARHDEDSALTLAGALVSIARMAQGPVMPALSASFAPSGGEFQARLERLLEPAATEQRSQMPAAVTAIGIFAAGFMLLVFRTEVFYAIHQTLELFVD